MESKRTRSTSHNFEGTASEQKTFALALRKTLSAHKLSFTENTIDRHDILLEPLNSTQNIDLGNYENSSIHHVRELADTDDHEEEIDPVFCEMLEFGDIEDEDVWVESARWVKFEETVETEGRRWSKPHVTLLTIPALLQLKNCFRRGVHHYCSKARTFEGVVDEVIGAWSGQFNLDQNESEHVKSLLLEKKLHLIGSVFKETSVQKKDATENRTKPSEDGGEDDSTGKETTTTTTSIMRKLREGSIGAVSFIARTPQLSTSLAAFVRFRKETPFPGILEIPIPVRFMFFLIAPVSHTDESLETIGRAFGTLMVDEVFAKIAFRANSFEPFSGAIDEFMGQMTTIPAGKIPLDYRMEPHEEVKKVKREVGKTSRRLTAWQVQGLEGANQPTGMERTGRCFGGLVEDIKRKKKHYISEFRDGLTMDAIPPVLASTLFIFIAQVTKMVTFGLVVSDKMHGEMGITEHLLAGGIFGACYALFAGQPLATPSPSAATFLFELILYNMCHSVGWSFLELRVWIGIWLCVFMVIVVAIDANALVAYATKFTQEPFAIQNSIIFMQGGMDGLLTILRTKPVNSDPIGFLNGDKSCGCFHNDTSIHNSTLYNYTNIYHDQDAIFAHCKEDQGQMIGSLCRYFPDVFFFAVVLFMGTYVMVHIFSSLKTSIYFPTKVRQVISDFAVPISIFIMTGISHSIGLKVPLLQVPLEFSPTKRGRSWIVNPFAVSAWYLPIFAILPGALFAILNVVGQGIVTAIVNRKEHRLRKGFGYHLDLTSLAVGTLISAFLGVPFYVCSPVVSIMHVESLKRNSDSAAPGEKPQFLGIREQRISGFLSLLLVGLTVLLGPILRLIPSAVLFGVFFYMGLASLYTQAMFLRVLLFFIPIKYQPDYKYLRTVQLKRVHLYTVIQVVGFIILMGVNYIKEISLTFPLAVVMLMAIRKLIERIFTNAELEALDQELKSLKAIWRPLNYDEDAPGCCGRLKARFTGFKEKRAEAKETNGSTEKEIAESKNGLDNFAYANNVDQTPDV